MGPLSMFATMLPLSAGLQFWPGDDVARNVLESKEYQNLPSARMKSVQEFPHSPLFASPTLKGAISSIPRWRFIRETHATAPTSANSSGGDPESESDGEFEYVSVSQNLRGVARGQRVCSKTAAAF